ncbi:Alpha/beta knot methyltransferase [Obelidium mucronatum]|nr:Alpha/beta knot methyltransferase [Obelidium mucronatum]
MKELLFGSSSVLAALRSNRRTLHRLFVLANTPTNQPAPAASPSAEKAASLALARRVAVVAGRPKSFPQIQTQTQQTPTHNGLVLECGPLQLDTISGLSHFDASTNEYASSEGIVFEYTPSKDPRRVKFPVWLALDQIKDPQNLGAIIRTCKFFNVDGIVTTIASSSPLSPTVSKASAGALESYETLYGTKNLASFLSECKRAGWTIYGTDISQPSKRVVSCWSKPPVDSPVILVMGSEGEGLRKVVANKCDKHLLIPNDSDVESHPDDEDGDGKGSLDSLNVSVATGILLSSILRV